MSSVGATRELSIIKKDRENPRYPVLVVVSGNILDIGRILTLGREPKVIGRDPSADFCLNDRQVSRRHLHVGKIIRKQEKFLVEMEDLNSTNGTKYKGESIQKCVLSVGETINIGETTLLFRLESTSRIVTPTYPLRLISKDPLTGAYNRRAFENIIEIEYEKAKVTGQPYCILMVDIDHFKSINDTWGHETGDKALKRVTKALQNQIRNTDVLARIGGEEFIVLLPGETARGGGCVAERLRNTIEKLKTDDLGKGCKLTISIGVAEGDPLHHKPIEIWKRADSALRRAKESGRNKVVVDKEHEDTDRISNR